MSNLNKNDFEYFLQVEHMKDYHGTDDDAPDAYEHWISNMDVDLLIKYGNVYGAIKALEAIQELRLR